MYHDCICAYSFSQENKKMVHLHSTLLSTVGFLGPSVMLYTKNNGSVGIFADMHLHNHARMCDTVTASCKPCIRALLPHSYRRYILEGKANILPNVMRKLGGAFDLVIHCKCNHRVVIGLAV